MKPHPAFQWRVYLKGVGYQYYAFYQLPREPFSGEQFKLEKRDTISVQSVGVYTRAQFEHRVTDIINRPDCELIS